MSRWAWSLQAGAVVGALAIAGPASASIEIAIGHDQRSGVYGGCGDASARCVYVQDSWDRDAYVIGPDRLPFMDGGAVTHLNMQLYTAAGTVVPRVVHVGHYDPATGANTYVVVGSGPPLTLTGTGQLDADVHLPVHKDDTLAFALSGGAQPYLDYDAGFGGRGYGNLFYGATDSDTELTGLKQVYDGDRVDGLVLRATLERDGDGDGFGDETQDPCPGRAGSADGCSATPATTSTPPGSSGPRKPPALTDLSLHHRVLAYIGHQACASVRTPRSPRPSWLATGPASAAALRAGSPPRQAPAHTPSRDASRGRMSHLEGPSRAPRGARRQGRMSASTRSA